MQNVFLDQISADYLKDYSRFGNAIDPDWHFAKLTFIEAVILSFQSYFHWVMLTISAAIVVSRAMRPQPQLIFAEDCVIDGEELVVRCKVIRSTVKLVNVSIDLNCVRYGRMIPLKLACNSYPCWPSSTPINVRHTIDESSPLHPKNGVPLHLMCVMIGINSQDASGLPISGDAEYWNADTPFLPITNRLKATEKSFKGLRFGRVKWDAKFKDCLTLLMDAEGESKDGVIVNINMDNFSRAIRSPVPMFLNQDDGTNANAEQGNSAETTEKNAKDDDEPTKVESKEIPGSSTTKTTKESTENEDVNNVNANNNPSSSSSTQGVNGEDVEVEITSTGLPADALSPNVLNLPAGAAQNAKGDSASLMSRASVRSSSDTRLQAMAWLENPDLN